MAALTFETVETSVRKTGTKNNVTIDFVVKDSTTDKDGSLRIGDVTIGSFNINSNSRSINFYKSGDDELSAADFSDALDLIKLASNL